MFLLSGRSVVVGWLEYSKLDSSIVVDDAAAQVCILAVVLGSKSIDI